jgi:hypothetical protein
MHKQILFNSIKIQQTHKCPVIYIITSINMDHGIYPPGFSAPFPANLDFYYWITSLFITFDNIWQEKDQVKPLIVFTIILKWVTAVFRAHNHSTVYADIITLGSSHKSFSKNLDVQIVVLLPSSQNSMYISPLLRNEHQEWAMALLHNRKCEKTVHYEYNEARKETKDRNSNKSACGIWQFI